MSRLLSDPVKRVVGEIDFFLCIWLDYGIYSEGYNNSTTVIPIVCKRRQKGLSEGSGKPLLYILSYKNTRHRGGGESDVSMNPGVPCLGYLPFRRITAWYSKQIDVERQL